MFSLPSTTPSPFLFNLPSSQQQTFITKKTLRGRKAKSPLPCMPRCSICLEFASHSTSALITCSLCQSTFHPSCYHIPLLSPSLSEFTCERCTEALSTNTSPFSFRCFICSNHNGILIKNEATNIYYHQTCLRLLPELYENNSNSNTNTPSICRSKIRKWRYKNSCRYCNDKLSKDKAVIKCSNPKCKEYYHIPCAIAKGMIFSFKYLDLYYKLNPHSQAVPFYCACHNKRVACAYRNDVINCGKCVDELDEVDGCDGAKGNKRKNSLTCGSDGNENGSTVGNGVSTVDGNESDKSVCFNDMDFFYCEDNNSCNSNNNALDLDFSELLGFEGIHSDNIGENVSPKLHINMLSFEF